MVWSGSKGLGGGGRVCDTRPSNALCRRSPKYLQSNLFFANAFATDKSHCLRSTNGLANVSVSSLLARCSAVFASALLQDSVDDLETSTESRAYLG